MRPGQLRHEVAIEEPKEENVAGENRVTWLTRAIAFAAIEPLSGREYWQVAQIHADVTHRIRLWYLPGLTPKMRIVLDGRVFNFLTPPRTIDERNHEIEILCREAV